MWSILREKKFTQNANKHFNMGHIPLSFGKFNFEMHMVSQKGKLYFEKHMVLQKAQVGLFKWGGALLIKVIEVYILADSNNGIQLDNCALFYRH